MCQLSGETGYAQGKYEDTAPALVHFSKAGATWSNVKSDLREMMHGHEYKKGNQK